MNRKFKRIISIVVATILTLSNITFAGDISNFKWDEKTNWKLNTAPGYNGKHMGKTTTTYNEEYSDKL